MQTQIKETSEPTLKALCERNLQVTGEFPAQRVSNAKDASVWWRHHVRHWLAWWSSPGHFLNICRLITNWAFRTEYNLNIFFQEWVFELSSANWWQFCSMCYHYFVMTRNHFPCEWPFVRGDRWTPSQRDSNAEFDVLFDVTVTPENAVEQRFAGDLRRRDAHVTSMWS